MKIETKFKKLHADVLETKKAVIKLERLFKRS